MMLIDELYELNTIEHTFTFTLQDTKLRRKKGMYTDAHLFIYGEKIMSNELLTW